MQALIALEELQNFSSENNEIFYQKGIIYFELELYEYAIENFLNFPLKQMMMHLYMY